MKSLTDYILQERETNFINDVPITGRNPELSVLDKLNNYYKGEKVYET